MYNKIVVETGQPYPLGATPDQNGVNFSIFSKHATCVTLLLFERKSPKKPFYTIDLNKEENKTYNVWHVYLKGVKPGTLYAYRVDGIYNPQEGLIYNKRKILIDPYAKQLDYSIWKRLSGCGKDDNLKTSLRGVVVNDKKYDWDGDFPLELPLDKTIIYELHVGNFTSSPTSKCKYSGKFKGIIEKIPYLKSLGITAIELMPIMDFGVSPTKNVWGYGTIGFFAPDSRYCVSNKTPINEIRDLVKALHKAGLEVILDMAFGYTAESDNTGPLLSLKGIDNTIYYSLKKDELSFYQDYSGCGNTLNCNHPVVAKFIIDCLKFWVKEAHVDGFRLDEATILSRDRNGDLVKFPHVLSNIDLSRTLSKTKFFVEPWDAAGAYQVGNFPGYRFVEWNDKFRDEVRRFVRGESGIVKNIANRMIGSPDLYALDNRRSISSLNFITAHDGFTLHDLVSYKKKHNEANEEGDKDGLDENYSENYGIEGDTDNAEINHIRAKQVRNMILMLLLSKGIPMITMGDEIGRTQLGNNNAYCHSSKLVWFDWRLVNKNKELLDFVKRAITFRKNNSFFYKDISYKEIEEKIEFHGCSLYGPGFSDPNSRVLSMTIEKRIQIIINMENSDLQFEIPVYNSKKWHLVFDTSVEARGDKSDIYTTIDLSQSYIVVKKNSIVVLESK